MRSGTPVRIKTIRPNAEQYSGYVGEITSITENKAYVCIGRQTIAFSLDELEAITSSVEGGAE